MTCEIRSTQPDDGVVFGGAERRGGGIGRGVPTDRSGASMKSLLDTHLMEALGKWSPATCRREAILVYDSKIDLLAVDLPVSESASERRRGRKGSP